MSFHLLFARRDAAELRARYTARISILESLISRFKQGEQIQASEIDRLTKLGRKLQEGHETDDLGDSDYGRENLSWKEVILGATRKEGTNLSPEDRAAWEWNKGEIFFTCPIEILSNLPPILALEVDNNEKSPPRP